MKRQITLTDASSSRKRANRAPTKYSKKGMVRYRQPSTFNRCIIATTIDYTIDLTNLGDSLVGFGFSPTKLWVDGISAFSYPTNIANIWDLCRIHKVEITVAANSNSADFSSGTTILIPFGYDCFDPNDNNQPVGITEIQQYSTCQMWRLDGIHKRTIYPNVSAASVIDVGTNRKHRFLRTNVDSPFNGYKLGIDQPPSHQPQVTDVRVNFKVFMEVSTSN